MDRQARDCRALAKQLGWTVVAEFSDNDVSAYSGKPRPGYRALLEAIADEKVDGVLAWHTDRLHRSPVELEGYITACEPRAVATFTVQAGHLDLSTPSGRMVARQLGAVARFESEHKGDRVSAARRQAAQEGRWQGGGRPFGFERDGQTLNPAEAAELAAATDRLLAGESLRSIVKDWNSRGLRTTFKAQEWTSRTVSDVLRRPRNAGLAVYKGEIVGPAAWPAIIPEDRWRAVTSLLDNPGRRTSTRGPAVRWLGSGIYVCGVCDKPKLRVTLGGRRIPAYRCSARDYVPEASGHVSRKAEPLDLFVRKLVVERLSRPDAVDLLVVPDEAVDTRALQAEAVTLRQRLDQLAEAFSEGAISLAQLRAGSARLQDQLERIDRDLAAAVVTDPLVGVAGVPDVGEVWDRLELERRRAVVSELLSVTVLPWNRKRAVNGDRFNPESIRVEWRRET